AAAGVTDLLDGAAAVLLFGILNAILIARIGSSQPSSEGAFLARVYATTLLLRAVLAILINVFAADSAFAAAFWGDSGTYDAAGHALARHWQGDSAGTSLTQMLSGYGFVYIVGALYYVFGRNQLLVQLLNCTVGALTVLVVYAIAARLFGRPVARWAALFMAFFPQMVFWSAGMYKDPTILLCIALCMYAALRLGEAFSPAYVLLFVSAALALLTLRFYIFYFVVAAAVGAFVFGGRGSVAGRLLSCGVLIAALAGGFTLGVRQETLEAQAAFMTLNQVQVTRVDQAMWGKSAYGTEYDVTTTGGALQALPVGLVYLLFAPFPWAITGMRQLLTVPETLVWYALMPAFARGLVYSIRHRLRDVLPILVFTVTLTFAYALMQGNVGTAYRQRTQVTMFFFVFMGVGIVEKQRRRALATEAGGFDVSPGRTVATAEPAASRLIEDHDFVYPDEADPAQRA
ncbi:MAG TPA: glycosyltransferase family 39 protein, partial [Vicinamibacteria bacterium]|nr:glycosyltransferase family 39 protein [Vicinamibacteria bacterium]